MTDVTAIPSLIIRTRRRPAIVSALVAWSIALAMAGSASARGDAPPDAGSLQAGMTELITLVDSDEFSQSMPWEEYVVLIHELAVQRPPTALELRVLAGMRDDIGFRRSHALAQVLRQEAPRLDWDTLRAFLVRVSAKDFVPTAARQSAGKALAREAAHIDLEAGVWADNPTAPGVKAAPLQMDPPNLDYNTYFGFLHAHCELSDGKGTPLEAYEYARDEGGLDFFSLTDHGEFLMLWPWQDRWQQLKDAAEATYAPGSFTTFWGFEWSNFILGHINIINSPDFTDMIRTFRIKGLYRWVTERPESFATFNHPGRYDMFRREGAQVFEDAIPQFVGVETWNTNDGFGVYHYQRRWGCRNDTYLDSANQLGWRIGALGAQDNHNRAWGTMNDFRTGVLAQALTRESLLDAYRQRRFYATEDKDLLLDFRSSGYPMGARLEPGDPRTFTVTASDESGDTFTEVRLYRNGTLLATREVNGSQIEEEFADPFHTRGAYYYAIVTQADDNDGDGRGDEAIASPIWFGDFEPAWGCAAFRGGDWWAHPLGIAGGDGLLFLGMAILLLQRHRRKAA